MEKKASTFTYWVMCPPGEINYFFSNKDKSFAKEGTPKFKCNFQVIVIM